VVLHSARLPNQTAARQPLHNRAQGTCRWSRSCEQPPPPSLSPREWSTQGEAAEAAADKAEAETEVVGGGGGAVVLNDTQEFCRALDSAAEAAEAVALVQVGVAPAAPLSA
jgi:hypothetical protein